MPSIFVSYRRSDASAHAGRLYDRLVARFGEDSAFRDVDAMEPGANFEDVIKDTVGGCDALIAVIGRGWLEAQQGGERRLFAPQDWVREEIAHALEREILVIPVLVDGASMPAAEDVPEDLQALTRLHAVTLREDTWTVQVDQLLDRFGPATPGPDGPSDLIKLRAPYCELGPLTLSATLRTPAGDTRSHPAYPTGPAGAHFVFPLHNPNRVDFIVAALEVEVRSYESVEIERLNHGVGATDTMHRFKIEIPPRRGRYRTTYRHEQDSSQYVRVPAGDDDVFDLEVTTEAEGLFELSAHVQGTLAGQPTDVCVRSHSLIFFARDSNYMVMRSDSTLQPFEDYIRDISRRNGTLRVYLG